MSDEIATSRKRRRRSWLSPIWLVPLLAAGGIGYVIYRQASKAGPTIEIVFREAEGLEADKTDLRYRGVKMGEVSRLHLTKDLSRVVADVQLEESATGLAREGSQFWIVRPQVSAAGVQGLGTIVSGAYIGALPGHGSDKKHFEAMDEPPPVEAGQRGLEVFVVSPDRGFQIGAPVLYHSIKVGAVADSMLSSDARAVRSRIVIERPYTELLRSNSRFWNAGGVNAHVGILSGLNISAQSFTTMVEGGVAFATPDNPGPKAKEDQEFAIAEKPESDWTKWNPAIHVGRQASENER
jgi:paraquat-inducible protein B